MLTSSVTNVQLLTEKMAILLPKPTPDISYIPQKVWDSLLTSKKGEYTTMQRVFEQNHNSRLFVGLKNVKLKLARPGAAGTRVATSTPGITIYDWLTRVKAADSCNMFSKVFECDNGDVELWHHVSHDQEARAWMSTALAEIAKLSGIDLEKDRTSAETMFKNPDRVWASVRKLHTGASLPAQRSVFMDFSPPTGIITFPNRQIARGKQKRGPSEVKLVFDIEAASTMSVITNDDTKSKAPSRGSRRKKNHGKPDVQVSPTGTTVTEEDATKALAIVAAKTAIQVADAAIASDPPKAKTAHQGAYATIPDKFGNLLPVVMIEGKWVSLTPATLRESRKKAPPVNFGLAARMPDTPKVLSREDPVATSPREQKEQTTIPLISKTAVTAQDRPPPDGFVRKQETSINAKTAQRPLEFAPAIDFGMEEFPPLAAAGESSSAPTSFVCDDNDIAAEEDPMDEHEDFDEGSDNSQGQRSTMSASTAGQSVVTFAQIAQRQAFDISEEADAIMHHSDCEDEAMQYHTTSSMAKLEKKTKKAKKQSSLAIALIHSKLDENNDDDSQKVAAMRGPIRPPERDSAGKITTPFSVRKPPPATAMTRHSSLCRAEEVGADQTEVLLMMKQMQQHMQNLAAENERLYELVANLRGNPISRLPPKQIDQICDASQVSTEIVEWLPSHDRRRSKKTPLQLACRTPPRPPPGTPQTQKKSKMSTSPSSNRFDALADDLEDIEMDEETEATLAAVEERIDNLQIRNTHVTPDSINKKNGAGGMK